ncbi:EamA family transporter [Pseudomonas sp. NPDC007930]|uniref:DMT family transporter n=1 Tax=Pseudomonas sp. NPDC007930 TaxID=3364417 RepID=UPI0036E210A1
MNPRKAIVLKIAATLCSTAMLTCVKGLEGQVPTGEVVFFRSLVALLPLLVWLGLQGNVFALTRTQNLLGHLGRSISGTCGMYFNYLALSFIPLADATALSYAAPLFTVILAALMLGERVRPLRWLAIALGFAGVLVMLAPHLSLAGAAALGASASIIGSGCALLAAFSSAASTVQIRYLNGREQPGAIVLWFSLLTTLVGAATWVFGWVMPHGTQWLLLLGIGAFGGTAQILVTLSLRHAHASLLAPFEYSTLLWSSLLGFVLLAQLPTWTTLAGGSIVAAAGVFTLWQERRGGARRGAGTQALAQAERSS